MHNDGDSGTSGSRDFPVALITADGSLLARFAESFESQLVRLDDAVASPERLPAQVLLIDVRTEHCHLEAARLATSPTLAVVLLARPDDVTQAMRYLDLGATDVLWSNMSTAEMHARVRAAARYVSAAEDDWFAVGDLSISLQRQEVRRGGEAVHLTPTEFQVLETLLLRASATVSHATIMARVWGPELITARHYLRVYIRQLREKLEDDPADPQLIVTVPGEGYMFNAPRPLVRAAHRAS
jgi:two-component system, OmpR family, KDP operon response regulator KdpE